VQLITDPQSRVAVKLNNKKESKGVLKSPFGVELLVDLVPQSESVSEDVRIFTSGIDELPDGIPVGTIGYIGDSQTQYYKLHVQTPIDFQKIRDLFVIIPS
ncbi:MAG: rod shape-determining protein MreC, partial [Candidatus Paceibacteria bacterium]